MTSLNVAGIVKTPLDTFVHKISSSPVSVKGPRVRCETWSCPQSHGVLSTQSHIKKVHSSWGYPELLSFTVCILELQISKTNRMTVRFTGAQTELYYSLVSCLRLHSQICDALWPSILPRTNTVWCPNHWFTIRLAVDESAGTDLHQQQAQTYTA